MPTNNGNGDDSLLTALFDAVISADCHDCFLVGPVAVTRDDTQVCASCLRRTAEELEEWVQRHHRRRDAL